MMRELDRNGTGAGGTMVLSDEHVVDTGVSIFAAR